MNIAQDCRDPFLWIRQRARVEQAGGRLPGAKEEDILLVANRDDLYLYAGSGNECIRICFKPIRDDYVALGAGDR